MGVTITSSPTSLMEEEEVRVIPITSKLVSEPLRRSITKFLPLAQSEEWDTEDGATGMCGDASDLFLHVLDENGIEDALIEHYDPEIILDCLDYPFDLTKCRYHWAVRVGDLIIDWTARQFDADAPFPAIWKEERREWRNVIE